MQKHNVSAFYILKDLVNTPLFLFKYGISISFVCSATLVLSTMTPKHLQVLQNTFCPYLHSFGLKCNCHNINIISNRFLNYAFTIIFQNCLRDQSSASLKTIIA